MTARIQRLFVFALLVLALAAASTLSMFGRPRLGLIAALVVIFAYSAVLAAELICVRFVEDAAIRPAVADLFHAWRSETLAAAKVFGWLQPFRSKFVTNILPASPDGRRGLLLVHGLLCNRGFWVPWMKTLRARHQACVAVDLEPVFGSISDYAATIENAVESLRSATGLPPVIVAHSMGGLAVRHWMNVRQGGSRVHRVITIGTPHRGTWLARFGTSKSAREMAIGSEWLGALTAAEKGRDFRKFTCFYGSCDNVVFPSALAQLPGADNRKLERTGHVALAFREEVFAEALRWIDAPTAPA